MTEGTSEDERDTELDSIQAIFPEIHITPGEPRVARLDLEVAPKDKLVVVFDAPNPLQPKTLVIPATPPLLSGTGSNLSDAGESVTAVDLHHLEFLPALHLLISLPRSYPDEGPPSFRLSSEYDWVPKDVLDRLSSEGLSLWEEYGHSQVVFAYIDFLQQEAEQGFKIGSWGLYLPHQMKGLLLDFNQSVKRRKFEQETFDCGICLEPKKGVSCHRLAACGHVFCVGCLQDFYGGAISEGVVTTVRCLSPDCGKGRDRKQHTLRPRELLAIPLERTQVQRYVDIKLKKKLDSDKTTIFCPRTFCQAPARSAKYSKYNAADLESYPESDDEEDVTHAMGAATSQAISSDRLSICSKCSYAFCHVCQKSWHGDLLNCRPPKGDVNTMSAEDKASYDYIRLHTSPCPYCNSPSQKTHGCCHMICATCNTHFCYLCSSWLDPQNPYKHYNQAGTGCYMRLWELEEGDEGGAAPGADGGPFRGPRAAEQAIEFAMMLEGGRDVAPPAPVPAPQPVLVARNHAPRDPGAANGHVQHAAPGLDRFLAMAANDEEDAWDSDELDDDEIHWGIAFD